MESWRNLQRDLLYRYGDPRVRHWKFMSDEPPTLIIIAAYLVLVLLILPAFMKNRKPYDLAKVIRCYNIFQIISNTAILCKFLSSGWIQGEYTLGCLLIDYSNSPNALGVLSAFYWTFILKLIDLVETVFFLLRKKANQVSGLHVYHHASTVMLSFIGCKFYGGGMFAVPVMLNLFIHILMYLYYFLSSLGKQWQKRLIWWKPKLTMAQMVQFIIIVIHGLNGTMPSCKIQKIFLLIYLPNIVLLYKMFQDFYVKSYKMRKVAHMEINGHNLKNS